jgi:ectoine hydroxylase-related dioxygenase (phytanoyl-CoA dioxygenase family)
MSQNIFKNPEHQRLFNRQGFIVLPLLDIDTVNKLNLVFDNLHQNLPAKGFMTSGYSKDYNYKLNSSNSIIELLAPKIKMILDNFQTIGASFSYKLPSPESDFNLHQDWTVVDEKNDISVNVWIPLCDTNIENGTLFVLPGSHYANFPVHRSPTIGYVYNTKEKEEVVKQKLIPISVKAGTAVIINHSLIHYSPPNLSKNVRKAIIAGYTNKGAQMYFYYKKPNKNIVDIYKITNDFYNRFTDFHKQVYDNPEYAEYEKSIKYKLPNLNIKDLEDLTNEMLVNAGYEAKYSNVNIPLLDKIISRFKFTRF